MKRQYKVQIAFEVYTGTLILNFVVVSSSGVGALQAALRDSQVRLSYYDDNVLGINRVTIRHGKLIEG